MENFMPNPNIFYHGSDRPLVQYELPEIKELHTQALIKNDQGTVETIYDELGHRKTLRAQRFRTEVGYSLDLLES